MKKNTINGFNRNVFEIETVNGEKIVSKTHQKLIFLKREEFFYDLFKKIPLIKTPDIYLIEGLQLKTYFVSGMYKNIPLAAKNWAKVHNYFIENPILESGLFLQHDINEVASYLLEQDGFLEFVGKKVGKLLGNVEIDTNLKTLLHGDLTTKNFISNKGINYYFDFELGGIGHPARDIASLIISTPNRKRDIIDSYKHQFNYNYLSFEKDIKNWMLVRASQLLFIIKNKKGNYNKRKRMENKLVNIIGNL